MRSAGQGLVTASSRVVLEKPIGHDLASAQAINDAVGAVFDEQQIFRIDHYLGKESVQNLLVTRFANTLLEPLWNSSWIDHVQITAAESLGVGARGDYYDKSGALRDMLQNHLLQVLCLVAMEPPTYIDRETVRDEKLKVLQALKPLSVDDIKRADRHRASTAPAWPTAESSTRIPRADAENPESTTETFVAVKAEINNWRWAGVPFYLRTGKRMSERYSEIVVQFKPVPLPMFPGSDGASEPNRLVISLQPDEEMRLELTAKEPGPGGIRMRPVSLALNYTQAFQRRSPDAYERLLMDVVRGDPTLFMRRDEVEAAWAWAEPILQPVAGLRSGAEELSRGHGRARRRRHASRTRRTPLARGSRMIHPVIAEVTARNHRPQRRTAHRVPGAGSPRRPSADRRAARLACANLAHGFAASDNRDKRALRRMVKPNVAIVSSYNDMLSAHKPFESYPAQLKQAVLEAGGIAQFAGGVPAMCDGITQGREGMQLSLFSRDVIAMATAIALSHDMFDAALLLGVCDKIVPGMLIGALGFGHLPAIFVPAGPMTSGLPNGEKAKVRQLYAEGKVGRDALLDAEAASYHGSGTCTFYGTANSNQLLMEAMGLHLPGASLVNPDTPLREALTAEAGRRVTALTALGDEYTPVGAGRRRDAPSSTDASRCSPPAARPTTPCTWWPLPAPPASRCRGTTSPNSRRSFRCWPACTRTGSADVNHFHAAGGMACVINSLLDAGLMHEDVRTVAGDGLRRYTTEPRSWPASGCAGLTVQAKSLDTTVVRTADDPFAPDGGLKTLTGNLGASVIKTSAVDLPNTAS